MIFKDKKENEMETLQKSLIGSKNVFLNLKCNSKEALIKEMLGKLVDSGDLDEEHKESALHAIMEREAKMSTGIQSGIAIPHAKVNFVEDLVIAIGIKPNGIDFDSLDREPARIFILTIAPTGQSGPYMQFLADILHLLKEPAKRKEILNAGTEEEVFRILTPEY
jgi:mannitol/fructose-specific phosphotransferase system IIA component (Ntr-type)